MCDASGVLRNVAVLLPKDVALFELSIAHEVFGIDRTDLGVPRFRLHVCSDAPGGIVPSKDGVGAYVAAHGLKGLRGADVIIAAAGTVGNYTEATVEALRRAGQRGAVTMSFCSGAFLLGAAGLLDDRPCTAHWSQTERLKRDFPRARVVPDVLYVDDGDLITSAGTAAGIDAALHLVRRELGAEVATTIARRMVVPPQRDGGQRQFVEQPVPSASGESLQPVLDWMLEHLDEQHAVAELAARAMMSPRTFARRFVAEVGTTPHRWLTEQRIHRARRMLERSEASVEQIAAATGYTDAAVLRHHFRRIVGVSPQRYRTQFGAVEPTLAG